MDSDILGCNRLLLQDTIKSEHFLLRKFLERSITQAGSQTFLSTKQMLENLEMVKNSNSLT